MSDLLVAAARELEGRAAEPTAGVIDSQSVKTTESGGICGYDAGKKTKGRKRHIVTDVLGLLLIIIVHAANIQDRDGAPDLLKAVGKKFPCLRHIFADGGYAGDKLRQAMGDEWTLEIVKRPNKPEFRIRSCHVGNASNDVWDDNFPHFDLRLRQNVGHNAGEHVNEGIGW